MTHQTGFWDPVCKYEEFAHPEVAERKVRDSVSLRAHFEVARGPSSEVATAFPPIIWRFPRCRCED